MPANVITCVQALACADAANWTHGIQFGDWGNRADDFSLDHDDIDDADDVEESNSFQEYYQTNNNPDSNSNDEGAMGIETHVEAAAENDEEDNFIVEENSNEAFEIPENEEQFQGDETAGVNEEQSQGDATAGVENEHRELEQVAL
jgi:hypothetical protein